MKRSIPFPPKLITKNNVSNVFTTPKEKFLDLTVFNYPFTSVNEPKHLIFFQANSSTISSRGSSVYQLRKRIGKWYGSSGTPRNDVVLRSEGNENITTDEIGASLPYNFTTVAQ